QASVRRTPPSFISAALRGDSALGTIALCSYAAYVISILRFIGVMNATVWFGSSVFFTFVGAPAIFSEDMKAAFGAQNARSADYFTGAIAQIVIARYFLLHHVCGAVALVHLLVEWLYLGKALERFMLGLLVGLFSVGLVGGFWLQPKLKE